MSTSPSHLSWCCCVLLCCLSGLTCAMYIQDGQAVPSPDPRAGLYICNRAGQVVQATIPPGHIAYQLGQVMAIQSGGLLRATPHYVKAPAGGPPGISRNTFAVFMQPEVDVVLAAPKGLEAFGGLLCLDSGHWSPGGGGGAVWQDGNALHVLLRHQWWVVMPCIAQGLHQNTT